MRMKNIDNKGIQWYQERIDYLAEFMTPERKVVMEQTLTMRTDYMTILTENMFHPLNASALVRHCEAFGIQQMHNIEESCTFSPDIKIAKGSHQWVDLKTHATTPEAIATLKKSGYRIIATSPHKDDTTPETFDVTKGKFALVFGTEHIGISDEVIGAADEFLKIPMCGMVESLNVSASAAIIMYMLSQRVRESVQGWELEPEEQVKILYRWMKCSVKDADPILNRKFIKY